MKAPTIATLAREAIARDLLGCSAELLAFFAALFPDGDSVHRSADLARALRVAPSTFGSRFHRAGLPGPKQYLALANLVFAAEFVDLYPRCTVSHLAYAVEASSPQSFTRHVRSHLGITAHQFIAEYSGATMLLVFRGKLIVPYLKQLRGFHPIQGPKVRYEEAAA